MAALSDTPWIQVLMPVAFLAFAAVVAVPPFALHILLHPFQYVFTTASLSERISTLQSKFFYFAWRVMSPVLDPGDKPNKAPLLAKARGTVLEIGPGVGDNIKYYNRSLVHRLILVEPNTNMHAALREKANQSGYFDQDGSLLLLGCGGAASDEKALALAGVGPDSIDSLMAIHVLCGIPQPAEAVEMYRRILKTGGLLTFYEHVRSDQRFTANWQSWYTHWIWPHAFDGCCLNRPTGAWIMAGPNAARGRDLVTGKDIAVGINGINQVVQERWSDYEISSPSDQPRYSLTPHVMGWAIKA